MNGTNLIGKSALSRRGTILPKSLKENQMLGGKPDVGDGFHHQVTSCGNGWMLSITNLKML